MEKISVRLTRKCAASAPYMSRYANGYMSKSESNYVKRQRVAEADSLVSWIPKYDSAHTAKNAVPAMTRATRIPSTKPWLLLTSVPSKATPSTLPTCLPALSTAEAMDRRSRGADSMQALVIAGTLNARPKPIAISMKQKTRYGVVVSVRHMLRNPAAPISESTIVGIYLEPVRKLSTRLAISSAAVSSAK